MFLEVGKPLSLLLNPSAGEVTSLGEEAAGYGAQASDLRHTTGEWAVFRVCGGLFSAALIRHSDIEMTVMK